MRLWVRVFKHLVVVTLFLSCSIAGAGDISFEINANTKDVAGIVEYNSQTFGAVLNIGGGVIFSEDDYTVGDIHFALKDEVFTQALTLGLGLTGVFGQAEISTRDYDIAAIGFSLLGEYDFRKIYVNLPVLIYAEFSGAPDPMSFRDTTSYVAFNTGVRGYIVTNAALVAGYRTMEFWFDDSAGKEKLVTDALYIGLQITF